MQINEYAGMHAPLLAAARVAVLFKAASAEDPQLQFQLLQLAPAPPYPGAHLQDHAPGAPAPAAASDDKPAADAWTGSSQAPCAQAQWYSLAQPGIRSLPGTCAWEGPQQPQHVQHAANSTAAAASTAVMLEALEQLVARTARPQAMLGLSLGPAMYKVVAVVLLSVLLTLMPAGPAAGEALSGSVAAVFGG